MSSDTAMEWDEVNIEEMVLHLWKERLDTALTPTSTIRPRESSSEVTHPVSASCAQRIIADIGAPLPEGAAYSLIQHIGHMQGIDRYTAIQRSCGRLVELRLLDPSTPEGQAARDEFLRESTLTSHLPHPNIASVEELNLDQKGRIFTSMPNIVSRPWSQILTERSINDNLHILLRVMDGISFAHSKGILHRDLKPGNILIGLFGEVLVSGWGVACEAKTLHKTDSGTCSHLVGTPAYMAPEVALGERHAIGIRTDIYQLGAILFEILTGAPPHQADTLATSLLSAAENTLMVSDTLSPLYAIAEHAMDLIPANRYATVVEFQKTIRNYLAHQESVQISARGDLHWRRAEEQEGTLDDYATALALYSESQSLWPENEALSGQIARVSMDYARAALAAGNLELAQRVLPVDDASFFEEDAAAYHAVSRSLHRKRKQRLCIRALSGALLILVVITAFFAYRIWTDERHWAEVYSADFTAAQPDLRGLQFMDATRKTIVQSRPPQGGLWLENGEWCWLRNVELPGDTRFVIRFDTAGTPDAVEIAINSRPDPVMEGHLLPVGQTLKVVVANERSTTQLRAYGSPQFEHGSGDVGLDLSASTSHEIEFRRKGGRVSILINGEMIQEDFSLLPVEGENLHSIGFRVWQPSTRILSIQVDGPRRTPQPSFLLGADRLVAAGNTEAAIKEYLAVSESRKGTPEAEEALYKLFMILASPAYRHRNYTLRHRIVNEMGMHYPKSTFNRHMMERMVILEMEMGRYEAMLAALKDLQREYPFTNLVEKIWKERPNSLPPTIRDALLTQYRSSRGSIGLSSTQLDKFPSLLDKNQYGNSPDMAFNILETFTFDETLESGRILLGNNRLRKLDGTRNPTLSHFSVTDNELDDLDALRGAEHLDILSARMNRIRDLRVFAKDSLPRLRILYLDQNYIEDLAPLHEHPTLTTLWLSQNRVRDLSPLAGGQVKELRMSGNPVADLTPLARTPLDSLDATGCKIEDLTPLRTLSLRTLWLGDNQIASLDPLAGMPLHNLNISNNPIASLEPLLSMPLGSLAINGTKIKEPDVLLDIQTLRSLDLDADQFSRLHSLGTSSVRSIRIVGGRAKDLAPLRNWLTSTQPDAQTDRTPEKLDTKLPSEHWFRLHHHDVGSLDPLEGKPLGILSLADNKITSLTPLDGMPLESFSAWGNQIEVLAPLRRSPLRYLDLRFNRIASVAPLAELHGLSMLSLGGNRISDATHLRDLYNLRWLELQDNLIFDIESLRDLSLNYLDVSGNQVADLTPLSSMPLTVLRCARNQIQSIAGVERRALVELHCADNQITSLEPILQNPLVTLDCAKNPISNMDILVRIPSLRDLRCDAHQLRMFKRIAETSILELRVPPEGILHDIAHVGAMDSLRHLELYGQAIDDPSPLAAPPLAYLDISDNPLRTLGTLADAPPSVLLFNSESIPDGELTRLVDVWDGKEETARHARTARILQAIRRNDVGALRGMGRRFGGSVFLYVPYSATWDDAREMAEALGGHLATIPRQDINTHVTSLLEAGERAWIGLHVSGGKPDWVREVTLPVSKERLSALYSHWFPSVIWQGTLYASGRPGGRWLDAVGNWFPSDDADQQYGFIIEWPDADGGDK